MGCWFRLHGCLRIHRQAQHPSDNPTPPLWVLVSRLLGSGLLLLPTIFDSVTSLTPPTTDALLWQEILGAESSRDNLWRDNACRRPRNPLGIHNQDSQGASQSRPRSSRCRNHLFNNVGDRTPSPVLGNLPTQSRRGTFDHVHRD